MAGPRPPRRWSPALLRPPGAPAYPTNAARRRCPRWTAPRSSPQWLRATSEWSPRGRDRSSPLQGSPLRPVTKPTLAVRVGCHTFDGQRPVSRTPSKASASKPALSKLTAELGWSADPTTAKRTPPNPMSKAEPTQSASCIADVAKPRSFTGAYLRRRTEMAGIAIPIPAPPTAQPAKASHPGDHGCDTRPKQANPAATSQKPVRNDVSRDQSRYRPCTAEAADQPNAVTVSGNPARAGL